MNTIQLDKLFKQDYFISQCYKGIYAKDTVPHLTDRCLNSQWLVSTDIFSCRDICNIFNPAIYKNNWCGMEI